MRAFTALLRSDGRGGPVLVPEGFSGGALLLGPVWLAAHRAFLTAALAACAWAALALAPVPGAWRAVGALGLLAAQGLFGTDAWRGELARHGYVVAHVVLARDATRAWTRLLAARPDLVARMPR